MRWARHMTFMGRREMHTGFWRGHLKETDHLEELGIDERIVLKWMHKAVGWEGMNWINVVHDREKWWAVVKGMKIHLP
jgi:hypothetical protein